MGFVKSYENLEVAFSTGEQTEPAVLGDVFLPSSKTGDLSRPIGTKIERTGQLVVPLKAGELVVAATARIVNLDYDLLARAGIEPDRFTVWTYMNEPAMSTKHILDWEEDGGEGPVHHQTRLFTTLTKEIMKGGDEEYEEYRQAWSAWLTKKNLPSDTTSFDWVPDDPDYPFEPRLLNSHMVTEISSLDDEKTKPSETGEPPEIDPWAIIDDHFMTLGRLAMTSQAFEYVSGAMIGLRTYCKQTPEQFQASTDWVLGLTNS